METHRDHYVCFSNLIKRFIHARIRSLYKCSHISHPLHNGPSNLTVVVPFDGPEGNESNGRTMVLKYVVQRLSQGIETPSERLWVLKLSLATVPFPHTNSDAQASVDMPPASPGACKKWNRVGGHDNVTLYSNFAQTLRRTDIAHRDDINMLQHLPHACSRFGIKQILNADRPRHRPNAEPSRCIKQVDPPSQATRTTTEVLNQASAPE